MQVKIEIWGSSFAELGQVGQACLRVAEVPILIQMFEKKKKGQASSG